MKKSVKKNYIFEFLYQALIYSITLVIAPHLTRTLGDTAIGNYTFSYSIVYYFTVFSMLGISNYGQRMISTSTDDEKKLRQSFWSLFVLHLIISIGVCFIYYISVYFFARDSIILFYLQGIFIVSTIFDVTWLFYGLQNFKSIILRNSICNILQCIFIFAFVKSPDDLYVYICIKACGTLFNFLSLYPFVFKHIKPIKVSRKDMIVHLKPLLSFAALTLSSMLYSVLDKTLLGLMSEVEKVAYYDYSMKLIDVPKMLLVVAGTVLLPKACEEFKKNNHQSLEKYYYIALFITLFIGIGSVFGFLSISNELCTLYFGEEFSPCGEITKLLSPIILFIGIGSVLRSVFIIPSGKENKITIFTFLCSIINILLSLIFIPIIDVKGAILGSLIAELALLIMQFILCKKYINFKKTFLFFIPFIIGGCLMYLLIVFLKNIIFVNVGGLILLVLIGIAAYSLISIILFLLISKERKNYINYVVNLLRRKK